MTRIVIAVALFVVCLSLSSAVSQETMGDTAGLEKTVNTFFGFLKTNDVDKVKSYYTADYTFTGPDGKVMSAEDRAKMLKSSPGSFVSVSDIAVRTYGNTGVSTGI